MKKVYFLLPCLILFICCHKNNNTNWHYYEVGSKITDSNWRGTSFIVATSNPQLIQDVNAELQKSIDLRRIVSGNLRPGSGGYNHNDRHWFRWHFQEDTWQLTDVSAELYDGRPYSDVDRHLRYWMDTVGRFSPWNSYIKKELNPDCDETIY